MRNNIKENIRFILGIINSKLLYTYYYENYGEKDKGVFPHFRQTQFLQLPIPFIDLSNPSHQLKHDNMVEMVDQMLEVQKKYHNAKTENEKTIYKKQIDILDKQIDRLVYKLYGLTDEERMIIEGE
jgi:hypothetical protein